MVSDTEAREFEESLYKLGQLSKRKVHMEDFTARDRFIILDLFVNNEKTLLKIYEALFQTRPPAAQTLVNAAGSPAKGESMEQHTYQQLKSYRSERNNQFMKAS